MLLGCWVSVARCLWVSGSVESAAHCLGGHSCNPGMYAAESWSLHVPFTACMYPEGTGTSVS